MKLKPEQVARHLTGPLLPVYMVHGEESLLVDEVVQSLRNAAAAAGFEEREVLRVESGFRWDELLQSTASLSLFASKRIIELHIGEGKLGKEGSQVLTRYAEQPAADILLLVVGNRLDRQASGSKWHRKLEQVGASIQLWPVTAAELPRWIHQRMVACGLQPTGRSAEVLAELVEGNLHAARQEIEKLSLLCDGGAVVDEEKIIDSVSDHSRFKLFDLSAAFLAGNPRQVTRVLSGLREEGTEPVLLLWLVNREIRSLIDLSHSAGGVKSVPQYLPQKQKNALARALRRDGIDQWRRFLIQTAYIDRAIKGAAPGNPWILLEQLCLRIAGVPQGKCEWDEY